MSATVEHVRRALGRANWYVAKWELDALETIGLVATEVVEINEREETVYRLADEYRGLYTNVAFSRTSPSNKRESSRGAGYVSVDPSDDSQSGSAAPGNDDDIPF